MFKKLLAAFCAIAVCLNASVALAEEHEGFYQPEDNAQINYDDAASQWSFARSRESEHFILLWEAGFGDDPSSDTLPENMRVDVDDLISCAERFYQTNVDKLGMVDALPNGYKMQIYLLYTEEWVATGSGYDNKIGALWVSPSTCQPVGSVIAHEVGHCFQYLIYAEKLAGGGQDDLHTGFRYGSGGTESGNALWEIGAQWQSWQDYPAEMFTDYEMDTWFKNSHRALENEYSRYQNYWWFYYLTETYGIDAYSRIWRESAWPEDAYQCFMRLYLNDDLDAFYDSLYQYAAKTVTFDFEAAQPYSESWQALYDTTLYDVGDGWQRVAYADCPEANGFAAVKLDAENASSVTVEFQGLNPATDLADEDPGEYLLGEDGTTGTTRTYNASDTRAGWRYGLVALCEDGTRVYRDVYREAQGKVTFDVPENAAELYFVVLGAPETYQPHIWDNDESTDVQMPFELRIAAE